MASNYDTYSPFAAQMAQQYGVPQNLFLWQIGQESGWDPNAQNSTPGSTATGIAQFIAPTANSFGIDPTNPYQSIEAAARYDQQLYQSTGSWQGAMAAYGTTAGNQSLADYVNQLVATPGSQIPSRPSTGNSAIDGTINSLLDTYASRAPAELAGVGNQAELDAWNNSWGGAIGKFETWVGTGIKRVGIVGLGIIIVGLAIWGLMRRS